MGEPQSDGADVTQLLQEWRDGRRDALDRLMPLVYDELHLIASRHNAREWRAGAMQTTALVNEAFLKLVGQRSVDWRSRAHFFAIAATMMRRILVDHARHEQRTKHGGDAIAVPLDDAAAVAPAIGVDAVDTIALDAALRKLEAVDPEQARIVELRFFGGLTVEETGDVMDKSPATIKREWTLAKGWLYRELTAGSGQA
jgi:RNA polymerase sigma factor (TIGR02999 family)